MDVVPDEILALILSFVPARTLLGPVRGTCRRWRALALDPSLWKSSSLSLRYMVTSWEAPYRTLVLSSAPCLRRLDVSLDKLTPQMVDLLTRTPCAVTELCLRVINKVWSQDSLGVRVLRNMAPHVRYLELHFNSHTPEKHVPDLLELLQEACNMTSVVHLALEGGRLPWGVFSSSILHFGQPHLQKLTFFGSVDQSLISVLFTAHSDTLRSLDLMHLYLYPSTVATSVCAALRKSKHLEELQCDLVKGLAEALSSLSSLTTLDIRMRSIPPIEIKDRKEEWVTYFTSALQLTSLTFGGSVDNELLPSYLEALASSGRSVLRCLTIHSVDDGYLPLSLPGFRWTLSGLPLLEELYLGFLPAEDVLSAVEDAALPALHTLRLAFLDCGSELVSLERLGRLLRARPALHVLTACQVRVRYLYHANDRGQCLCPARKRALDHRGLLAQEHGPCRACRVCTRLSASIPGLKWGKVDTAAC